MVPTTPTTTNPHPKRGSGSSSEMPERGKSSLDDNIPVELIKNGGEAMISTLTIICNKIWETGEWPTPRIITIPKKGNLQIQCM